MDLVMVQHQFSLFNHNNIIWRFVWNTSSALLQYVSNTTQNAKVDLQLRSLEDILTLSRKNVLAAQRLMKHQYDKYHLPREFEMGDMVYLKLQKYRQYSVAQHVNYKLAPGIFGLFKVLQRIGKVA